MDRCTSWWIWNGVNNGRTWQRVRGIDGSLMNICPGKLFSMVRLRNDWRWSPFPFSYYGIPLVGSNLIFPFSCWPVFLALSFPVDCAEAFSMFDHSYLNIRVSQFLRFHALFLSTSPSIFGHVYSRGYVSMPILFPRIGDRYTIPIFAPASLPAFFCILCRKIPTMRSFWMCSR